MTNPVWVWIAEKKLDAYHAKTTFDGPSPNDAGPGWSFSRFGQTKTELPDGRVIRIGGEYEDYYDPDFYIYNDVIVTDAAGHTEIFGYAEDAFPPTDFHTADLAGDRIIVIGNLSYPPLRKDKAQVFALDTAHYRFDRLNPAGESPPWLYKHASELVENGCAILVRGGAFALPQAQSLVENIDDWRLDLETCRWERLTDRAWPRFVFARADGQNNHLYWLRDLLWARPHRDVDSWVDMRTERLGDLGCEPRPDLIGTLYAPAVPHAALAEREEDHRVYRIAVEGITVRYVENNYDVVMTIEGMLPAPMIARLCADLQEKLAAIENTGIDCIPLMVARP
ncbi:MAG TPA: hypothetical protein VHZ29_02225 [Rhizomicrobium sp.]|nr:hypothetical protein [Rhizomicrobium sp.]